MKPICWNWEALWEKSPNNWESKLHNFHNHISFLKLKSSNPFPGCPTHSPEPGNPIFYTLMGSLSILHCVCFSTVRLWASWGQRLHPHFHFLSLTLLLLPVTQRVLHMTDPQKGKPPLTKRHKLKYKLEASSRWLCSISHFPLFILKSFKQSWVEVLKDKACINL